MSLINPDHDAHKYFQGRYWPAHELRRLQSRAPTVGLRFAYTCPIRSNTFEDGFFQTLKRWDVTYESNE